MSQYLLVANPTAQSGRAKERIEATLAAMKRLAMPVELVLTQPEGRTVQAVADAIDAGACEVVISLGGDGTFAEVAKGVLDASRDVTMAMLPAGTANDQGRSFGVAADPDLLLANLDIILRGHITLLDVGTVSRIALHSGEVDATERVFHSVGWGMQAQILKQRNADRAAVRDIPVMRDLYRDEAVYFGATLKQYLTSLVEPTRFDVDLIADGRSLHYDGLSDIVVNATPVYAGRWVLDRNAEPDDGRFEVIPVSDAADFASKAMTRLSDVPLSDETMDLLTLAELHGFRVSQLEVLLTRPDRPDVCAQIDGEEWLSGSHFRLTVERQRLPLITPHAFVPPWRP